VEAGGGVLLVDKPVGPTSHDVVARVRKKTGIRRVGHAGTLDPFASGLLILLLGKATRLSEYLLSLEKEYIATARMGVETATHDLDGDVVREDAGWTGLTVARIEEALASFSGTILQEPPAYSAKKIRGEAAHRRVRRGESVEMKPVEVVVHEIHLLDLSLPRVDFRVRCSSGTYIRALARDLGVALRVGAHLTGLRRTRIGGLSVEDAVTLDDLEEGGDLREKLLSPARALSHLPAVTLEAEEVRRIRNGQEISLDTDSLPQGTPIRILLDGELVAMGLARGGQIKPRKVLVTE